MYEIYAKLRDKMGLKDYEVCKRIGISPGTMSDWKNGRYNLKADKLRKLAAFFGVTVDYLMGLETTAECSDPLPELTDDEAELLRLFRLLNKSGQIKALEALEDLSMLAKYTSKNVKSSISSA